RVSLSTEFQQEIHLERLFQDVAVYTQTVTTPMHAQYVVDTAVRNAKAYRGPAVVLLPADIQTMDMEEPSVDHFVSRTGVAYGADEPCPDVGARGRAAEVLNAGEKRAVLVGQGATGRAEAGLGVAGRLGASVTTPLLGK